MKRWRPGRWVLLTYVVLLALSHLVRDRTPTPTGGGDLVVSVEGFPAVEAGVGVAFRAWGDEATGPVPPLLLLHGSPGSGSVFGALAPLLADGRRVLAPDLPGFGSSTRKIPDYSIRAHAGMVLQALDSMGIGQVDVVGFSLGGGVALEMVRQADDRVRSLTLLSAIGVQEHELLGDYHLNHAIHGLQLFGIWALAELVPHFGAFDSNFLSYAYARNFYDTDQRPLRGILEGLEAPLLILHGDDDPLVPPGAALEHRRIVPQSELVMLAGDHFMTFLRPDVLTPPLSDFLGRVQDGTATRRSDATRERQEIAAVPFDPASLPRAYGFALFVTVLLIAAATFVSEDLTCIGAGLLIARGTLPWTAGILACLVGIFVGDLLLYAAGRYIGRPVVRIPPMRWMIRQEDLDRSCRWFTRRSGPLILWGRFVPGTRLPTYVAAGVVHLPFLLFAFWGLVAAILWTPLLVGAAALFGTVAADGLRMFQDRAIVWLAASALVVLISLRLLLPLASARGRSYLAARWDRLRRWEFWPPWIFYPPVVLYVLYLGLKHRSPTLFTAANPGIEDGGFVGESKATILSGLGAGPLVAATVPLPADLPSTDRVSEARAAVDAVGGFPVVVKPDVGERGAGVSIVRSDAELIPLVDRTARDLVVQEYVPGVELGVFYYRMPDAERGDIFGITDKRFPSVMGDGSSSIEELILSHSRLRCQAPTFLRRLGQDADRIPEDGEAVSVGDLGNHCLGSEFRDGSELETPELFHALDELSKAFDGFFYGRYDLRAPTLEDMLAGRFKVIELNGVSSEATNIYDPTNRLWDAYRTLFAQWRIAFAIGAKNAARGTHPTSIIGLARAVVSHFRPGGARWA